MGAILAAAVLGCCVAAERPGVAFGEPVTAEVRGNSASAARGRPVTVEAGEDGTISVRSGTPPAKRYEWNGRGYRLRSWQLVEIPASETVRYVRETVLYEAVEQTAAIPETISATVTDEDTGRSVEAVLSLSDMRFSNWRWVEGFAFPVTVWGYDTGSFVLGEHIVPVKEEHPFAGYETELLRLIGVDPVYYRIDSAEWSGEAAADEDGRVFRQAAASGRKYVADAEADYNGHAVIPVEAGTEYQAIYALEEDTEPVTAAAKEPAVQTEEPVLAAPEEPRDIPAWIRILRQVTVVVVGLGILLVPPLLLLLWRRKREREKGESGGRKRRGDGPAGKRTRK